MGAEDLAYIEDSVLRMIQKKTGPRWSQDAHSAEAIKEAIDAVLKYRPPPPGSKVWYMDATAGHDVTGNGSQGKPYKTLGKGHTEASAKDTLIGWGAFDESITIVKAHLRLLGLGPSLSTNITTLVTTPINFGSPAHGCEVAGFLLSPNNIAQNGILSGNVNHLWIHDNLIVGPAAAGVSIIGDTEGRHIVEGNTIYNCQTYGIEVGGMAIDTLLHSIIRDNRVALCGTGIRAMATAPGINNYGWIYSNRVTDMVTNGIQLSDCEHFLVEGNTVMDAPNLLVDNKATNYWVNNKFNKVISGTHTTIGVAEEIVFTDTCVQPMTRESGYLRLINMIAGDDFTFRTYKSYDAGGTWDLIDLTNLVGVQIIQRYNWDLTLENRDEQLQVTIQRNGAVDRAFIHRRVISSE